MTWHLLGVHKDMESNIVATMMLGSGVIQIVSTKQKVNARSSTEAELISIDDLSKIYGQNYLCRSKVTM